MKIIDCAQRSARWEKLRLGIATASQFHRIWTPPQKLTATGREPKYPLGQESKGWHTYANQLLYERKTGLEDYDSQYRSQWMERGQDMEEDAIHWYELANNTDTEPVGFITSDDGKLGCSPDRLARDDGLVEFKSPRGATYIGYFLKSSEIEQDRWEAIKALDEKYWTQLQGQLLVTERKWVDIVPYHPMLVDLRVQIRVTADIDYISALAGGLRGFNQYLDRISEKLFPDWAEKKQAEIDALPQQNVL